MTVFDVCASRYTGKERDTESGNDYFGVDCPIICTGWIVSVAQLLKGLGFLYHVQC
jgi:hypothetical protein